MLFLASREITKRAWRRNATSWDASRIFSRAHVFPSIGVSFTESSLSARGKLFFETCREATSVHLADHEMWNHREFSARTTEAGANESLARIFFLPVLPALRLSPPLRRLSSDGYVVDRFIDTCRKTRVSLRVYLTITRIHVSRTRIRTRSSGLP